MHVGFYESRKQALKSGTDFASNSFSPPGTASDAELVESTQIDLALGNYSTPNSSLIPIVSSALILRPGEEGKFTYTDDSGTTVTEILKHPLVPSDANGKLPATKMDNLLDLAPIHVELRARVKPLLSLFIGTRTVRGVATTYRDKGIRRVASYNNLGQEIPLGATRKTRGPEVWLTAPEPLEPSPTAGCVTSNSRNPVIYQMQTASNWNSAFGAGLGSSPFVVNTNQVSGTCGSPRLRNTTTPARL